MQEVIITRFVVLSHSMVTVYYRYPCSLEEHNTVIDDQNLVKLAKYTQKTNLGILAVMNDQTFQIKLNQDFEGKHEYMVSEVMDE